MTSHIKAAPYETDEVHYEMIDGQRIPNTIEFRGYDYYLTSILSCEDEARIEAMRARRDGDRATVKRNGVWWVLYLR